MVEARRGTPMAAAIQSSALTGVPRSDFWVMLFYLSPTNEIEQVSSRSFRGESWYFGDILNYHRLPTAEQSQLAVWWALCPVACSGGFNLFFEDASQRIMYLNSTGNWKASPQVVATDVVAGSGLAVAAVANPNGTHSTAADSMRIYYDKSDIVKESLWTQANGLSSEPSPNNVLRSSSARLPQVASVGFRTATTRFSPLNVMTVTVLGDGTVLTDNWDDSTWHGNVAPSINSIPTGVAFANLTSVALASDMRIYCLTDENQIHSLVVSDSTKPWIWTYESAITTV
jgi:hypothetical protein